MLSVENIKLDVYSSLCRTAIDANRHGVLLVDAGSLRQCAPYCVNLRQLWKGRPDEPVASVDRPRRLHGF